MPQNSSEASLKTHPKFSSGNGQSDPPSYLKFEGQKPQSGGRPSGPRVIHHIPLRDQEQRLNGKKGWRGDVKEVRAPRQCGIWCSMLPCAHRTMWSLNQSGWSSDPQIGLM